MKKILRNPFWLLLIYILFILAFAFIYTSCYSDKFYHTTLKYEKAYQLIKDAVLENIKSSIVNNFQANHNDSTLITVERNYLPAYLHIERIHLENLEVKENEINFTGYFYFSDLWHMPPGKGRPNKYNYTFSLQNNSKTILKPSFSGETRELWVYSYPNNPIDAKFIIPQKDSLNPPSILLSDSALNNINSLINYNQGVIKNNSFKRMLYFSAITIATVGYGDIVPVDDNLRLVVGLEAILGIIFIGLFINSFGDWLRKKQNSA